MCTIAILHGVHPEFPVVVASNRDEALGRAATGTQLLSDGPVRVVGGRDVARRGTWSGVASTGVYVGITNQRTFRPPDPTRRSRGEVVLEALRTGSVAGVKRYLGSLDPAEFNAFNLLFGEVRAEHATGRVMTDFLVAYARPDPASIEFHSIPHGIHVLANDRIGSHEFPKAERVLALARPLAHRSWPELSAGLASLLADHELPPAELIPAPPPGSFLPAEAYRQLQSICVHAPAYGTRSSTIVALAPGRVAHYLTTDGPPCTHPFEDFSGLVDG